MRIDRLMLGGFVVALALWPTAARAGIPECGDVRLEDVKNCKVRASVDCMAGCSELGVYKTSCATKLHRVCRQECTLTADATCTDSCTVRCSADCDLGVNVICSHNCFKECVGTCDGKCGGAANPTQCRAECEATCDGECDVKCRPVVSGSCYTHCIECCGGSCTAQANMDCQTTCQDRTFEDCEREFRANCTASCSVDGALFCDGKYVLSGKDIPACVNALIARGTIMVEGKAGGMVTIGGSPDGGVTLGTGSASCAMGARGGRPTGLLLAAVTVLGLAFRRRRAR